MKLVIAGKYLQIDDFVELVTENPLTNNFDTQYAQYSNTFEVKYNGVITSLIDISKLRKSESPYLLIDGHIIADQIFIPVQILINSFDTQKNTVKLSVTERILSGISGGINIREAKLTELNFKLNLGGIIPDEFTDMIILSDGSVDKTPIGDNLYVAETPVLADSQTYPHAAQPANSCPVVSISNFVAFLYERYGILIENAPSGNVFSNRQKANPGDLIKAEILTMFDTDGETSQYITPSEGDISEYPAGVDNVDSRLNFGATAKSTTYKNRIGDLSGRFVSCEIDVPIGESFTPSEWLVEFKGEEMALIEVDDRTMVFGIVDLETEVTANCDTSGGQGSVISFRVSSNESVNLATFRANVRMNISIADNEEIATPENTRQVLKNLPDVTVLEFFKAIAKATASAIELTDTGLKFIDLADTLTPGAIVDASPYLIEVRDVNYKLFDAPSLEYWYKKAETPTLIVPITDARVKGAAKKIDIDILRTDDANVVLFEEDGIKPLEAIATYPFLDITDYAPDLLSFYLSIQKPFVIKATFRNFPLSLSNSVLVRQLNGLFIPKKIIKTNRDIIELELLKLED